MSKAEIFAEMAKKMRIEFCNGYTKQDASIGYAKTNWNGTLYISECKNLSREDALALAAWIKETFE